MVADDVESGFDCSTYEEGVKSFPVDQYYPIQKQSDPPYYVDQEEYKKVMNRVSDNPDSFWSEMANSYLVWNKMWEKVKECDFATGNISWFKGGKLNVSYNCIDRWALKNPNKIALIWERDLPGKSEHITYGELLKNVCKMANLLKSIGVRVGDVVTIYMPMIPQAIYSMLACARIGAIHSVVFGGFSTQSLAERILNSNSSTLVTADFGYRGGKVIPLGETAIAACEKVGIVKRNVIFHREEPTKLKIDPTRDLDGFSLLENQDDKCDCEIVESNSPLFVLYTSGSTGRPKGIVHGSGGYLLHASMTTKLVFNLYSDFDRYACVADIGWITGHSYVVYGPLSLGASTVLFESVPTYPEPDRYWRLVEEHKLTHLYTAPTAIRTLMRYSDENVRKHDLSSLRIIGSVGEPINPDTWKWLYEVVGSSRASVVDTYWQTETGGHVIAPIPGAVSTKAGSACLPLFGISAALINPTSGKEVDGNDVYGVLVIKDAWPGMMIDTLGDHNLMLKTYFEPYPGYYFTGDGAYRDKDGYYWIMGRVDDTINVSGHLLSTAEIEHALTANPLVAESAVVGYPDPIKGNGIFAFCILKLSANEKNVSSTTAQLRAHVRSVIGPVAVPDKFLIVEGLPKTRSGKIMRRILRKLVVSQEELGDTSTLADPGAVNDIIKQIKLMKGEDK